MARKLNSQELKSKAPGEYGDGGGLYFVVAPTGGRSWKFRFTWGGARKEFSLGDFPAVSLASARDDLATLARTDVKQGIDPRARYETGDKNWTFIKLARTALPDWIAGKHKRAGEEWEWMLADCVSLQNIPVATMTMDNVLDAIRPHWNTKPITASRYLGKIAKVMDLAIAKGYRDFANPAQWKGRLALQLTDPRAMQLAVKGEKRFARKSLPHDELPAFMRSLSYDTTIAARCVEFAILTGGRSQEARLAEWSWYDEKRGLLHIPARVMKAREKHTVVLCAEAIALLKNLPRRSSYIFPSEYNATERDEPVLGGTMLYRVRKIAPVDVHGFRATFRNFAGAETDTSFETAEIAIAHKVGSDTTRAYFNDPVYKKRAELMAAWGAFACSKVPAGSPTSQRPQVPTTNVVPLRATA